MDRILAMSLVGAAPGNVFGPGMSAGALESFARDGRAKAAESSSSSRGAAAGGTGPASAGSGGMCAAKRTGEAVAKGKGVGGQEVRAADANVTAPPRPALDGTFGFEFDDVVAPY